MSAVFFFQAEDGIRDLTVTGVQTCALPISRVLKPGARFVILEFATPRFSPLRAIYLFYFRRILPAIGRLVSKHRDAYTYLPESVLAFPEPEALSQRLVAAGFSHVGFERLTVGICAVHYGLRQSP